MFWCLLPSSWAAPPAALPSRPARPARTETAVPAEHRGLRQLLLARHDVDLPGPDVVAKNGGATSLTWLASNDDLLVVRRRALLALQHFPSPAIHALCRSVAMSTQPGTVRSAAVGCVGKLEDPKPLLQDPDARVRRAAEQAFSD